VLTCGPENCGGAAAPRPRVPPLGEADLELGRRAGRRSESSTVPLEQIGQSAVKRL